MQQRFNKPPCCWLLCIKVPSAFYNAHCEVKVHSAQWNIMLQPRFPRFRPLRTSGGGLFGGLTVAEGGVK